MIKLPLLSEVLLVNKNKDTIELLIGLILDTAFIILLISHKISLNIETILLYVFIYATAKLIARFLLRGL